MDSQFPHTAPASPSKGKHVVSLMVRYLLPFILTILLVAYMFHKVDFADMLKILRTGVNYWWILCAMGISVFSHIFRAARWRLQLRGLGIDPPFMAIVCSIFGTYALNLVFPRLGEVWRCTYISRRQKASFSKVLGSMVADRLSDTLMVLMLFLLTFVVASPAINAFLDKYPIGRDFTALLQKWWFWAAAIALAGAAWLLYIKCRHTRPVKKIVEICTQLWQGFAVVISMKGRGMFVFLTFCIWGCYFLQLYVAFFAFPFTSSLCRENLAWGLAPCLVAFVLSSIGMAVPSNGGLGPWNIAVIFGLAIYGISDTEGTAFSMLVWSAQTVMLILLGILTMVYIAISGKKTRLSGENASDASEV